MILCKGDLLTQVEQFASGFVVIDVWLTLGDWEQVWDFFIRLRNALTLTHLQAYGRDDCLGKNAVFVGFSILRIAVVVLSVIFLANVDGRTWSGLNKHATSDDAATLGAFQYTKLRCPVILEM